MLMNLVIILDIVMKIVICRKYNVNGCTTIAKYGYGNKILIRNNKTSAVSIRKKVNNCCLIGNGWYPY
ncbi:hypothetical protein PIROE2DRAFT_18584 [Piromyces sp. E2]|nr:hypothetical protein PIROE2DRAFT_18584 [Piromyces sp. E2]|eukprot:OUM56691.1 hypothetical protein PIROE2DRAFT_18584 [Piromyces sp. E2]